MPKFHSLKHRSLRVAPIGVKFVDGYADVTEEQAEVIRRLQGFDIVEVDEADFPTTVWDGLEVIPGTEAAWAAENTSAELPPINPTAPHDSDLLKVPEGKRAADPIVEKADKPAAKKAAAPRRPRTPKADTTK